MLDTTSLPLSTSLIPTPKWDNKIAQYLKDVLGGSAWDETYGQTFVYRWRGEDTLTWGNVDEWILVKWLAQQFFAHEQLDANVWNVINEARIASLEAKYEFRNPVEVKGFLMEHNQTLSVLWNARSVVEEFFGNNVSIALEVVHDPEAENIKQLFGYINAAPLSPDEAFERFTAFDETWFLKQFELTGGLFNFNLE
jgi:hypothetical protein